MAPTRRDRIAGVLLGTALGDALGLPAEGMTAEAIRRRFGTLERFALVGRRGFVSDDTEQTALVAEALIEEQHDPDRFVRVFRRSLLGWFLRLPFGIGLATLRACLRIACLRRRSGVSSAGNGAAMRAAIVGAVFDRDLERRRTFGARLATVTHTDPRAVEAALFVAELAAVCMSGASARARLVTEARGVVSNAELRRAIDRALDHADRETPLTEAARDLGTSGFAIHSVALATYCFLRFGDDPLCAIQSAIGAGGDTDSNAAIVGAWVGGLHGSSALPRQLLDQLDDGPFGRSHLEALADALVEGGAPPRWSWIHALLRNLMLYPVVVAHVLRRLLAI